MATQAITAPAGFEGSRRSNIERLLERNVSLLAAQQRARRGPTPEVFFVKRFDNSRLVKAADPVRVREMRTFACAIAVLFALIMTYGWQHLSSIEYGYRIESEKQQMQQLEEQNRQLRLSEAQLGDPARIDQMARQLGLTAPQPGQVVRPDAVADPNAPALAEATPMLPPMR
jgi:cell division protein FtsL